MPFQYDCDGKSYTLYNAKVNASDGSTLSLYFFSEGKPIGGEPCNKPEDHTVKVNPRTKIPFLMSLKGPPNLDKLAYCPICGNEELYVISVFGKDNTYSEYMILCPSCDNIFFSSHWSHWSLHTGASPFNLLKI